MRDVKGKSGLPGDDACLCAAPCGAARHAAEASSTARSQSCTLGSGAALLRDESGSHTAPPGGASKSEKAKQQYRCLSLCTVQCFLYYSCTVFCDPCRAGEGSVGVRASGWGKLCQKDPFFLPDCAWFVQYITADAIQ